MRTNIEKIAVFLVVIALVVGVTWQIATYYASRDSGGNASWAHVGTTSTASFTPHALGETVVLDQMALTVESVRVDATGAGPLAPHTGNIFVVSTITIENRSGQQVEFIPLLQFYLKDRAGNVYNATPVPSNSNELTGPILPHDKLREELGFEVAKNASGLTLYFSPGLSDNAIVAVALGL